MARVIVYLLSVVAVGWAAVVVPLPRVDVSTEHGVQGVPQVLFTPGTAPETAPLLEIDAETTPIEGHLHLLTVHVAQPSLLDHVRAALDPSREVTERVNVIPEGVDPDTYFRQQRVAFEREFEVAAAVGLRLAGHEVPVRTAPSVAGVLADGPSDGRLELGDVVLAVDGDPVFTGDELADRTRAAAPGDTLALTVRRGDERREVEIEIGDAPRMDRPGLGIVVETVPAEIELPFSVTLGEDTGIGGPSAGMMFALTVYDLVSDEDLARGRVVAGTGTVDLDGTVGRVGGIEQKVPAAEAAGATLFLAPASQAAVARRVAGESLRVVAVDTIDDALAALRR